MDLGSLLLLLSILILVAFFVARPLIEQSARLVSPEEQAHSLILAERERILEALQELDFDYKLGKIPAADYPPRRTLLLQQGAEILKQLDALDAPDPLAADAVEVAIVARRERVPPPAQRRPLAEDDDIETMLAARRLNRKEQSSGFCPQCGHSLQQSDKFCSKCGHAIQ